MEKIIEKLITIPNALSHIEHIRSMVHSMGNNDYEFSELDQIKLSLEQGNISPEIAIEKADNVKNSKLSR